MKYSGFLVAVFFVYTGNAMECGQIVPDSPSQQREKSFKAIANDASKKVKNIWRTVGINIITQDPCYRHMKEFEQIVNDCSCDVLYDLLYCAVKQPHGRCYVETLLNTRKDCCPCGRDTDPLTPLHLAIKENGPLETIELLLKKGGAAFNDKVNSSGSSCLKTPLSVAAHYDRTDVLRSLLADADTEEIDEYARQLIQKKYTFVSKIAQLTRESDKKSEDVLRQIETKEKEWTEVRSAVIKSLTQQFLKRKFKCL